MCSSMFSQAAQEQLLWLVHHLYIDILGRWSSTQAAVNRNRAGLYQLQIYCVVVVLCLNEHEVSPAEIFPLESYDSRVIFPCKPLANSAFPRPLHQNLEEGVDSLSESANQMLPPPTTSLGNLSSLDMTNDEDLPTDPSNSSDTQEESECCLVELTTTRTQCTCLF